MNAIPEGTLTLTFVQEEAKDTKVFRFKSDTNISFAAGQFLSLKFEEKSWRAYSIASSPDESEIELIVRIIEGGVGSTALDKASIGDKFTFRGPYGMFKLSDTSNKKILCATGTGIAPFRSMVLQQQKTKEDQEIELWYGGRNPEDIGYINEIKQWNISIKLAFSQLEDEQINLLQKEYEDFPNIEIYKGRITQFPEQETDPNAEFYICGNGDMVKSLEKILKEEYLVEKSRIHKERFN